LSKNEKKKKNSKTRETEINGGSPRPGRPAGRRGQSKAKVNPNAKRRDGGKKNAAPFHGWMTRSKSMVPNTD